MADKELIQMSVRIPADLLEEARVHVARRRSRSMQELVANALRAYLDADKASKKRKG